jgi:hypothetical protein
MKRILSITVFTLLITTLYATVKVEVYYFHFSRRCATCQAVETESKKIVEQIYAEQIRTGKVKFITVNLDEKRSQALTKKCKAEGQALLIISNNKRIDLTEQGFMFARSQPEKLKEAIKKAIDSLLK